MLKLRAARAVLMTFPLGVTACGSGNGDGKPDVAIDVRPALDAGDGNDTLASLDAAAELLAFDAHQPGLDASGETARDVDGGARLLLSPSGTQSFASTLGVPSTPIIFGVANAGDAPVGPLSVTVTGRHAADFAVVTNTCTVLAPLAACTVAVVFTPTAAEACVAKTATLVVRGPGPDFPTASVELTEYRSIPPNTLCSNAADLGAVVVGATGTPVTFTLTYPGTSPPRIR